MYSQHIADKLASVKACDRFIKQQKKRCVVFIRQKLSVVGWNCNRRKQLNTPGSQLFCFLHHYQSLPLSQNWRWKHGQQWEASHASLVRRVKITLICCCNISSTSSEGGDCMGGVPLFFFVPEFCGEPTEGPPGREGTLLGGAISFFFFSSFNAVSLNGWKGPYTDITNLNSIEKCMRYNYISSACNVNDFCEFHLTWHNIKHFLTETHQLHFQVQ